MPLIDNLVVCPIDRLVPVEYQLVLSSNQSGDDFSRVAAYSGAGKSQWSGVDSYAQWLLHSDFSGLCFFATQKFLIQLVVSLAHQFAGE